MAQAGVIVSTYNSTPPGYVLDGYGLSDYPPAPQQIPWAMQFLVPTGPSFQFTGFTAAFSATPSPAVIDFVLLSDAGNTPGATIETIPVLDSSSTPAILTGTSALGPTLAGGTRYWLEASLEATGNANWYLPVRLLTSPPTGLVADRDLPSIPNWNVLPDVVAAFEIDGNQIGTAVPEPATGTIVLACLSIVLFGRRRWLRQ